MNRDSSIASPQAPCSGRTDRRHGTPRARANIRSDATANRSRRGRIVRVVQLLPQLVRPSDTQRRRNEPKRPVGRSVRPTGVVLISADGYLWKTSGVLTRNYYVVSTQEEQRCRRTAWCINLSQQQQEQHCKHRASGEHDREKERGNNKS